MKLYRNIVSSIFQYKITSGIIFIIIVLPMFGFVSHEVAVRHFQDRTCIVCHEMKKPIEKWKESGTSKNHNNCAACHFDDSLEGKWKMHKEAFLFAVEHFKRDPNKPLEPAEEPMLLDPDKVKNDPAYWSMVPNNRCYSCKNVRNDDEVKTHIKRNQDKIHGKDIDNVLEKPCRDCHNHEMRKGQKFCDEKTKNKNM